MYEIDQSICTSCGACQSECPVNAIYSNGEHYIIDQLQCIACGNCADACPVGAIKILV